MNRTLHRLREIAQESTLSTQDTDLKDQQSAVKRAALAAPLIQAFKDVDQEFVRISILKQIWPRDYDRREDRVAGLLAELLGPPHLPSGLKLWMPNGYLRFEVNLKADGIPEFMSTRETDGQRPLVMEFASSDRWMEFFYKTIADMIEL